MEIKPLDHTVKSLLESSFFRIPRFQRPYSWDRENVEDFWRDAVLVEDPDYFIGSFVLYEAKDDRDLLFVVDGQQRLTTVTLLLAATRDTLQDLGFGPHANGIQKLIERHDINSELRFVLDSETPYPYLQEHIQKFERSEEPKNLGAEQKALKTAYDFLLEQVRRALMAIEIDSTVAAEEKDATKQRKLLEIRDRVLRLQLISVRLGNEDDAYLIFETLNTRGKDLTVSDLVKNHLTRLLKPTHKGVDTARDKWISILELFDRSENDLNVNRFLHHSWLSRNPYTTEKKLFRKIKERVDRGAAQGFLDSLAADAQLYRQILEPDSYKWTKQERSLADSIRALNVFRVVQPVPMMLALLRGYRASELTLKQVTAVFSAMENFHVEFTAVTSQRTGGGTAFMYASSARQLTDSESIDARQVVLRDFVKKLRERVPSYEEFEAAFGEIRFTEQNTRQRALVRYILRRIDSGRRSATLPDYDALTIEHIASQRPSGKAEAGPDAVGALGNLLLVTEEVQKKLRNKPFREKLGILKSTDVPLDDPLLNTDSWDDEAIYWRTRTLARFCFETVFRI